VVRQLQALLPWLLRHSGRLRELTLAVELQSVLKAQDCRSSQQQESEVLPLLEACLVASGSGGSLQQLAPGIHCSCVL